MHPREPNKCVAVDVSSSDIFQIVAPSVSFQRAPMASRESKQGRKSPPPREHKSSPKRPQDVSRRPQEAAGSAPRSPTRLPRRAQEKTPDGPSRGPQEGPRKPKRGPKRPQNDPQEAPKLPPRGPRNANHEIPTNIHEVSDPPPRHGGGIGRRPLDKE